MPGPAPKPSHLRQRTNKRVGATTLGDAGAGERPKLPDLGQAASWHHLTVTWWGHVWESPMSGEYLTTDVDGLIRVAILVNDFYLEPKATTLAEIRLQEQRFGLSPLDRRRLEWEIAKVSEAEEKRTRRQPAAKTATRDPRAFLQAVK